MKLIRLFFAVSLVVGAPLLQAQQKDFHDQELNGKSFKQASLSNADFTDATLRGADFTGAILKGAVFKGADLASAIFNEANLTGASFTGAVFDSQRWALFQRADLSKTNFEGVDVTNLRFDTAKFREANLRNTKGWGFLASDNDFSKADLRGANFRGMHYYQEGSIPRFRGAIYDEDTTWPDGFDPKAAGAILQAGSKEKGGEDSKKDEDTSR